MYIRYPVGMLVASIALASASPGALTQGYPSKPVRFVVPTTAAGPIDTVTRIVSARLSEQFGQQVNVDNRPGAGGSVGAELVARAPADGYNLLMGASGPIAIAPNFLKLPYNAERDLAPVGLVGTSPLALVVHPTLPAQTVKDLIALAKSRPGAVNFGSSGQSSSSHLSSELLKMIAQIDIVHVPYKGAGPALTDLAAGQTQMMFTGVSSVLPHIHSGRVRAMAVTSAKRIAVLPGTPAVAESVPGYEVLSWYGVLTTIGTPPSVITQINQEIGRAVEHPSVKSKLAAAGVEPETGTPEQLATMIRTETAKWGKVVKTIGLKVQ